MAIGQTSGIEKKTKSTAAIAVAYTMAKFGADDDTMSLAVAATDDLVGVFQHTTAAADEEVRVMLSGISQLKLGGTVTRGQLLTADSAGKGVAAAALDATIDSGATAVTSSAANGAIGTVVGAVAPDRVIGRAMKSGVSGDIITILLGQS